MTRGYPDYSPGAARTPEGLLLPIIALPPIWWSDDFESPLPKWGPENGTISIISETSGGVASALVNSGTGSMKIESVVGDKGSALKYLAGLRNDETIGIAMHFLFVGDLDNYEPGGGECYLLFFRMDTGEIRYDAFISYDPTDGKIYLWDENEAWVHIATNEVNNLYWNYAKLVIDLETGHYVRLYFNDAVYDISAYPIFTRAVMPGSFITLRVRVTAIATKTVNIYVDDYKVTYGEK